MAVVAAMACLAGVAGCTQPTLQPLPTEAAATSPTADASTPTPTPAVGAYSGTEPQSSEEAVEVGTLVYQQYLRTYAEVYRHPADTSLIDEIATGVAADSVKDNAAVMVRDDWRVTYDDQFSVDSSMSLGLPDEAADGRVMQFGTVGLVGCVDFTQRAGTWGPDQVPVTFGPNPRVRVSVIVEFWPEVGRFMVVDEGLEGGVSTPC